MEAPNLGDIAALFSAFAALVVALGGVIYQLRLFRCEVVSAVERHKNETIQAMLANKNGDTQ